MHWPEAAVAAKSPIYAIREWIRLMALLSAARIRRVSIVVTLHNLASHEQYRPRVEFCWVSWVLKSASVVTVLSAGQRTRALEKFPILGSRRIVVIPHFDWRHRLSVVQRSEARSTYDLGSKDALFVFAGLIRPYKGVSELLRAFSEMDDPDARLFVLGKRSPPRTQGHLLGSARNDPRVWMTDRRYSDDELERAMAAANVAVFPFSAVENSGSVLVALSLNRPVIVAALPPFEELRAEFGSEWIRTYTPPLTGADLESLSYPMDPGSVWPSPISLRDVAGLFARLYRELQAPGGA